MLRTIELAAHDVTQDAGVMIAAAVSRLTPRNAHVGSGMDQFCSRMRGFTLDSYRSVLECRDQTPLPAGYDNVRVFDGRDGVLLGSYWLLGSEISDVRTGHGFRLSTERATAETLIWMCLSLPFEEITAWRSTRLMESSRPGTLDLMVDIDIRPREMLMTGDTLPDHVVRFMARRARRTD